MESSPAANAPTTPEVPQTDVRPPQAPGAPQPATAKPRGALLAAALAKAQAAMKPVPKERVNSHFGNKFADLSAVLEAARKALTDNNISWTQQPLTDPNDTGLRLVTTLHHDSGESISSELWLPIAQRTAQGYGSALTYARRYGFQSLVGLAAEEDDDANAAVRQGDAVQQGRPSSRTAKPASQQRPPGPPPAPKPSAGDQVVESPKFKRPGEPGGPTPTARERFITMLENATSMDDVKTAAEFGTKHLSKPERDELRELFNGAMARCTKAAKK